MIYPREECSALVQHNLPPKLKDVGSVTILSPIGTQFVVKVLCDLGAVLSI